MLPIEQAVFTSAETDRFAGYQVVAASPGVSEADHRELAVWGPSHDALLDTEGRSASVNFHPLPSGASCVSRTTSAGWEYSGRGGRRVYTQCLVVPPEALARFAHNPFALHKAALAAGSLRQHEEVPHRLSPVRLTGRAAAVDEALLRRVGAQLGASWMATLVQAALGSVSLAVASGGGLRMEDVLGALLACLPPESRVEFSFSTGLKFSPRRPFRIVALDGGRDEQRRVARVYSMPVLNLDGEPPAEFAPADPWPRLIFSALRSGKTGFLAHRFAEPRPELEADDLSALGLQLLEELEAWPAEGSGGLLECGDRSPLSEGSAASSRRPGLDEAAEKPAPGVPSPKSGDQSSHSQVAHKAHQRFSGSRPAAAVADRREDAPSKHLHPDSPEVVAHLEKLDDLVYDAIAGETSALDELAALWPRLREELGVDLLAESREQYLRYALRLWEEVSDPATREPGRAVHALEVLGLLFDPT